MFNLKIETFNEKKFAFPLQKTFQEHVYCFYGWKFSFELLIKVWRLFTNYFKLLFTLCSLKITWNATQKSGLIYRNFFMVN